MCLRDSTIIPGEEGKLRKDIFLERAIVEERVRLAMGLPTRRMDEHLSLIHISNVGQPCASASCLRVPLARSVVA